MAPKGFTKKLRINGSDGPKVIHDESELGFGEEYDIPTADLPDQIKQKLGRKELGENSTKNPSAGSRTAEDAEEATTETPREHDVSDKHTSPTHTEGQSEAGKGSQPETSKDSEREKQDDSNPKNGSRVPGKEHHVEPEQRRNGHDKANNKFHKRGRRSDLISNELSSDPDAIRRQVEFYFSDSNLPRDKFLYDLVEGPENRPVPITVIRQFRRMQHYQPFEAVVKALVGSKTLEVVVWKHVEEDHTLHHPEGSSQPGKLEYHVRRKVALPSETGNLSLGEIRELYDTASEARTVYAKGFGHEKHSTQFDIEAFFANYGHANAVRLRRHEDGSFKGSVFVEFETEEEAKKFLTLDPPPSYDGRTLNIMSKAQQRIESAKKEAQNKGSHKERDWRERAAEDRKKGHPRLKGQRGGKHQHGDKKRRHENNEDDATDDRAAKKIDQHGNGADDGDAPVADAPPATTTESSATKDAKKDKDEAAQTENTEVNKVSENAASVSQSDLAGKEAAAPASEEVEAEARGSEV